MSNPAIVFISHSTRDDPRASALAAALDATGRLRAVIDQDHLRDGQLWRDQLYRWIARCDAGFVLLTPEVMARPGWVLQEATLLRSRKAQEGDRFPVFVRIEEAAGQPRVREHETWKQFFEPLQLTELQFAARPDDAAVAAAVADECDRQGLAGRGDLYSRLKSQFEPVLAPLLTHAAAERAILTQLEMQDARWEKILGHDGAPAATLAQRLCDAREDTHIGRFEGLDRMFQFLRGQLPGQPLGPLLALMKPYWVYLGAALQLAGALMRAPGRRIVALPTDRPAAVVVAYLDRIFGPYNQPLEPIQLSGGNDSLAELQRQFIEAWNLRFADAGLEPAGTAAELNKRIAQLNVLQVVVLPRQSAPNLALDFCAAFPAVGVIVPVPPGTRVDAPEWRGMGVIDPVRPPDVEMRLALQYAQAKLYARA